MRMTSLKALVFQHPPLSLFGSLWASTEVQNRSIEVFKNTHWSESHRWTTERAKEDYTRDVRLSELPEGSELDSDTEEEIYSQVLSSERYEKYGFKRGIGPIPRKASQARKSRGSGYERLQNDFEEHKRHMEDMEVVMKQQQELIQKLLHQINQPLDHPRPSVSRRENSPPPPPPPPLPALVC